MILKKIGLVFCLSCVFVICSCGESQTDLKYTFDNKSSYTVQITLSKPYQYETGTDSKGQTTYSENTTAPFSVRYGEKSTVLVDHADVNFQWTSSDNSKVYCTISGSKATFRNR